MKDKIKITFIKNQRKTIVCFYDKNNKLLAKSAVVCHKDDMFEPVTGVGIALERCLYKGKEYQNYLEKCELLDLSLEQRAIAAMLSVFETIEDVKELVAEIVQEYTENEQPCVVIYNSCDDEDTEYEKLAKIQRHAIEVAAEALTVIHHTTELLN